MKIVIIGGEGFVGPEVVRRLTANNHSVAVFHRGVTTADLPTGVHHILGNRMTAPRTASTMSAIDTTRIGQELGFREPVSREEALKRTVAWERLHPPQIDPKMFDCEAEDRILTELEQSAGS